MIQDAHGWWLREAGGAEPVAPASGELSADVVVIGGGYAGMWTAWNLLERGARVVLLEAEVCGHGPSGRNGGFCETLWSNLPSLRERFGDERALAACEASSESVRAIGDWCEAEGVDAWFRQAGFVETSTSEAQDAAIDEIVAAGAAVAPGRVVALDAAAVRVRCDSPRFRRGLFVPDDATLHPARLALGLRRRLLERGVAIHERSRVRALQAGPRGVVAETATARVKAGAAILTVNAATRGIRPLRSRLSVTSSHIVLTEPVPDVLEQVGWTGGESVTDARTFLHYFRTTRDGRILFGWGGGQLACGARLDGRIEVDPGVAATIRRHLVDYFPALEGRAVTHAWGGPIDVSPPPAADRHARRRPGALRVRLHRQRRRPVAPGGARPRRAGKRRRRSPAGARRPGPAGPARAARLARRDGRPRRLPARRAPPGRGPPPRPAHPCGVRGPAGAGDPRLALTSSTGATVAASAAATIASAA